MVKEDGVVTQSKVDFERKLDSNRKNRARLALMDLIETPARSWYETYIPRTLAGGQKDIDVFDRACALQKWTVLFGPTGAGKTLVGLAVAAKRGSRYASINFHGGISSDNLIGRWVPAAGTGLPTIEKLRAKFKDDTNLVNAYIHKYRINYRWVDGVLTDFFRNGGVLDLAEINMAPPAVSAFLFQMLDDRCQIVLDDKDGEVVRAHKDFWLLANFNEGYAGTEELNDALLSRFPVKFFWGYSDEVENQLITNKAVLAIGRKLRASGEVNKDVGTRDLRDFQENVGLFGSALAQEMFVSGFDATERAPVREVCKMEFSKEEEAQKKAAAQAAIENDAEWKEGLGSFLNQPVTVGLAHSAGN